MPWIVGIDEAGYGPNLGPLVMTSVACRVPDRLAGADLWQVLRAAVRRHTEPEDDRLLVEDSKLVYSSARGILELETSVLAVLAGMGGQIDVASLSDLLDQLSPAAHTELNGEPWYSGEVALPVLADSAVFAAAARFERASTRRRITWGLVRSVVVCPSRFNEMLDRWGSKGAVLGHGLAELLAANWDLGEAEPVSFTIDKHGGRNNYAAMLQEAIPHGTIVAHEEGMVRSAYSILGLPRAIRLTFQPRADAEHFCVALASMVSKYLRELLMLEFNRYWQTHVPGLKATAGYPGDSTRFWDEIRPAIQRLGIAEAAVWRRK